VKIEECCSGVNGCNLSKIDDFRLDVALSPLSFPASSSMIHCASDYLSLNRLEIFIGWGGM